MATEVNVDPSEIRKFAALAERWWDPDGDFRPLHDMNRVRVEYIAQRVAVAGRRVLDVGCGGGLLTEALAQRGAEVLGIDMGEMPLQVARRHAASNGVAVQYEQTDAEALAEQRPAEFAMVTCLEVLEHVPDPARLIAACARLAEPGAHLFFSTINRNPKAYLLAVLGAEYVLGLLPRGTHDYARFITPAELSGAARRAGLTTEAITGMRYNPFVRRASLTDDVSVNYLLHARRPPLS